MKQARSLRRRFRGTITRSLFGVSYGLNYASPTPFAS